MLKRCYNLEFVLKTILVHRLDWIDVVFIEDTQDDRYYKNEIDSFKYTSNNPRTITIKCHLQFCTFRSHFGLISKSFKRHMLIVVENVEFTDTRITLYNMNVHFKNVKFVNTTLTDKPVFKTRAQLFDLIVTFTNIIFLNPSSNGQCQLNFELVTYPKISIEASYAENYNITIKMPNFWLQSKDTSFNLKMGIMSVQAISLCSINIHNFSLNNQIDQLVPLHITAERINVEIVDSQVQDTFGGILLENHYSGFAKSWLQVNIIQSKFLNNTKKGLGAVVDPGFPIGGAWIS